MFQTYRTSGVPDWILRCRRSVEDWAATRGYDYRFYDDEFFSVGPDWLKAKSQKSILPLTDFCRLIWIQRLLDEGFERVIWMDIDLLIFDPDRFELTAGPRGFSLTREISVYAKDGGVRADERVNNSIMLFERRNGFLSFYTDAALELAQAAAGQLRSAQLGTYFLTAQHQLARLPLHRHVGCFAPNLLKGLYHQQSAWVDAYRMATGGPVRAANLCRSLAAGGAEPMTDAMCDVVVGRLIDSRGQLVN